MLVVLKVLQQGTCDIKKVFYVYISVALAFAAGACLVLILRPASSASLSCVCQNPARARTRTTLQGRLGEALICFLYPHNQALPTTRHFPTTPS